LVIAGETGIQEDISALILNKPCFGNLGIKAKETKNFCKEITSFISLIIFTSWDEIGNYDIPSIINYIIKSTGQTKLSYIGHSLGCGVFFIAMVKHPELNAKIDIMVGFNNWQGINYAVFIPYLFINQIALAPLSSFAHFTTPLFRILTPFSKLIQVKNKSQPVVQFVSLMYMVN
jgi:pimeloyl-ACP methyl ester carboxylesterase